MQDDSEINSVETAMFDKRQIRKVYSSIGFSYVVFSVISIMGQILLSMVMQIWKPDISENMVVNLSIISSVLIMYLTGFPVFWLLFRNIPVLKKIKKQNMGFGTLAVIFLVCVSMVYIGNIVGTVLMVIINQITGIKMVNTVQVLVAKANPSVIFLATIVVAPVMEEMMYRKLLIDRTIPYGEGGSIFISGLLFGLAHGNFYQFFYAFALGVIFAYVYVRSGNVVYTIILHMMINFMGSMIPMFMLRLGESQSLVNNLVIITYGLFIIGLVVLGVVLLACYRKQIVIKPGLISAKGEIHPSVMVFNIGMLGYLVISSFMFFLES